MKQKHLFKVVLIFIFSFTQAAKAADCEPQCARVEFCFEGKSWYLELDEKTKCTAISQILVGFVVTKSLRSINPGDLKFFIRPTGDSGDRLRIWPGKDDPDKRRYAIIGRRGMDLLKSGKNKVYIELRGIPQ